MTETKFCLSCDSPLAIMVTVLCHHEDSRNAILTVLSAYYRTMKWQGYLSFEKKGTHMARVHQ